MFRWAVSTGSRTLWKTSRTVGKDIRTISIEKKKDIVYSSSQDSVINSIAEFDFNPVLGVKSAAYFRAYEKVFQNDCAT